MQEFDQLIAPDKITVADQKEAKKETRHLGKIRFQKGQKFWELNVKTGWIQEIVFDNATINLKGAVSKRFMVKEDCIYTVALNLKNANKKFIKMTQRA